MAKLYYFAGRGKGEIVRLTLAAAGIQYTQETVLERSQFLKWIDEGKMLFRELPMVEIDGKQLVQTNAIVRYVARKGGLFGKNEDEAVMADVYFEAGRDFISPILPIGFIPEDEVLKKVQETTLPKYLPIFEKVAADKGTGYLVSDALTLGDISIVEGLLIYVEYLGKEILNPYPALQKFFSTVTTHEKIAAYLNGPQRTKKNDETYVKEVRKILGRV